MPNAATKRRKLLWSNKKKRKNGYRGEYRWVRNQRELHIVKWIGRKKKDKFVYESHEAAVASGWQKSA